MDWKMISIIFLCWAVLSTLFTTYYLYRYEALQSQLSRYSNKTYIYVTLGINYGNDSKTVWFNNTRMETGSTLLDLTCNVSNVNYTSYGSMGCFVNSINGVENENPMFWMWWYWNDYSGWIEGPVAADKYVISDGEILMWFYENTSISPLPTPP